MSYLTNRRWCIVLTVNKENINFSEVVENPETLRYSLDGTKFIVKYDGSQPLSLNGYTEYTHSEILAILSGTEWTDSNEP
jgi:hypothetical protein